MMKNWLLALFSEAARAIPHTPRRKCRWLNSGGRLGSGLPPVPVPGGIAALRHEPLDHAMKRRPVVESLTRQCS